MATNKSISESILKPYPGADRATVKKMLMQAAQAGRADERDKMLSTLAQHRKLMLEAFNSTGRDTPAEKKQRVLIRRSIRTIDGLIALL